LLVGFGSGGSDTLHYDFKHSGHNESDCERWCASCWGNPHCTTSTKSAFRSPTTHSGFTEIYLHDVIPMLALM
jgi:hypothetical protein